MLLGYDESTATNTHISGADMATPGSHSANTANVIEDDRRPHLQRLPAELRNNILSLALVENETINVKLGSWPGILVTCKQLREEGLPVFLVQNTFVARIMDLDKSALVGWLKVVQGLSRSLKARIRSITVLCEGDMIDVRWSKSTKLSPSLTIITFKSTIDFWDRLLNDIKMSGLAPHQVIWPDANVDRLAKLAPRERLCQIKQLHLLNKYVLTPQLRHDGMLDPARKPGNVKAQMKDAKLSALMVVVTRETHSTRFRYEGSLPERWFPEWYEEQKKRKWRSQ